MSRHRHGTALNMLLVSTTLANTAETISMVAIPWFVLELTGSYAQMGIVGFFTITPRVVAMFFGGQIIDRVGFRTGSIASDILSGISVSAIPILYINELLTFPLLLLFVSIGAVFDGPGATARESLLPELVHRAGANLDRINAFLQSARRLSVFIGPVIAGFMVTLIGTSNVLWLNAAVFALSATITLIWIPDIRPSSDRQDTPSFWQGALFGFRYLRDNPLLLWLATIIGLFNFLDAPFFAVQLPALVNEYYGSASRVGLLLGANGLGAVVSSLIFSALAVKLPRRVTMLLGFLIAGGMFYVLAVVPPFPFAWTAMLIMGLAAGPINPILMTVRQERVPVEYRARVFGAFTSIAFVTMPLGQLLGGYTVEYFGVRTTIAAVATAYTLLVVAAGLSPTLRRMDREYA
ncbi:MAG: MFS transporter [Thermomicrobiales bacterium]|nr:MFS transporter [Thermomicrobiales bacterium]